MATRSGGGTGKLILGFVLGIVFVVVAVVVYFRWGSPPVATADKPFPLEKAIVEVPLTGRIGKQIQQPPFGVSEDVYETGAKVYKADCADCHGTPGHDIPYAKYMYPVAPPLWKKHGHGNVIGVSDDEPGETYWKVYNGIRLSGMPAFNHVLTTTQMWDVTLLVKNADQQLPDPVMKI